MHLHSYTTNNEPKLEISFTPTEWELISVELGVKALPATWWPCLELDLLERGTHCVVVCASVAAQFADLYVRNKVRKLNALVAALHTAARKHQIVIDGVTLMTYAPKKNGLDDFMKTSDLLGDKRTDYDLRKQYDRRGASQPLDAGQPERRRNRR